MATRPRRGSGYTASVSPDGALIPIIETAEPGDLIDSGTAASASSSAADSGGAQHTDPPMDERTLSAVNNDTVDRTIHVQVGGIGIGNRISKLLEPQTGLRLVLDREPFARGVEIRAWADATAVVNVKYQKQPWNPTA